MLRIIMLVSFLPIFSFAKPNVGLLKGSKAPQFSVKNIKGERFNLNQTLKKKPVVLVFYRGGWCPYCNLQLRGLQTEVLPSLREKGVELVAVSVDKIEEGIKTFGDQNLDFTILSDSKASIIKKYKVDYRVPKELVKKYKTSYKIDLERSSGQKHHIIATPAVYVINQKNEITFSYVNEDYKVRAQSKDILKAVKDL